MIVSYQVKAEFGRILADKKKVKGMVENFKELQKKTNHLGLWFIKEEFRSISFIDESCTERGS